MDKFPYKTSFKIGQSNLKKYGLDIHHPVFPVSALLVLVFVLFTLIFPDISSAALNKTKNIVINYFDVVMMGAANFFVIFCILLALSPLGRIRIGGVDAVTDHSHASWFAMLFSAGMGIGLMFWSVAEPIAYASGWYHTPLNVEAGTEEAAHVAMAATLYHWTFHPWAVYALVGLSLAFFYYSKKLPLTLRSAFYPIFSEKIWGWRGHIIDLLAVFATIFGLATSLGLGATQAASGLHFLFGWGDGIALQVIIIGVVTMLALISVLKGLDGGVKVLSNINMVLALMLLLFVFFVGSSLGLLQAMLDNVLYYAEYVLPLSEVFGREDQDWQHAWTVFYWAWWISWSPFVGMFIARISKGRTVREFIIAVLFVPSIVTLVWMTVFGNSGLEQYQQGVGELAGGVGSVSLAMFQMLEHLPLSQITSFLAIILVLVFFITSSDSGSLVIDSITSGGKIDAPVAQRIFWALMEGAIAIALLVGGGQQALKSLQAGAVSAGLPFTFVLLLMAYALLKALINEHRQLHGLKPIKAPDAEAQKNA